MGATKGNNYTPYNAFNKYITTLYIFNNVLINIHSENKHIIISITDRASSLYTMNSGSHYVV